MEQLTEFEKDSLGELINMAMGSAAGKLQELSGNEVNMSVPHIKLIEITDYKKLLQDENNGKDLISVSEAFNGSFKGNAVLIFHFEKSLNLVKNLVPDLEIDGEFNDLEEEVLTEVGNILLNSCISTFANVLNKEFNTDIPKFNRGNLDNIIEGQLSIDGEFHAILLAEIDFTVESKEISGHMALTLTLPVLRSLLSDLFEATGVAVA